MLTADFTWDPGMGRSVRASIGGVVAAAIEARSSGVAGSLSGGLHHARYDRDSGFCTFNGLVLAAKASLAEGTKRVLILDLDAHCGGGTHSLIQGDARIRRIDVSVHTFDRYAPSGANTLALVPDAGEYLSTIEDRLSAILREREAMVFEWLTRRGIPIAFVLAGGYAGGALERDELVALHRTTIATASIAGTGAMA